MASFQKMLKSIKLIHFALEMMKSSLMTLEMMMKTLMISKANSALHIPVFSEDCSTVWMLTVTH